MKVIKSIFVLAFMALISNSCLNDNTTIPQYDDFVVIINQGNYNDQNGSISYYNEITKEIENNILKRANGNDLGAIIQSAEISSSGALYVVCNNKDKIEVFNVFTGKNMMSITTNLSSPRYLTGDGSRLYITNRGEGVSSGSGWKEVYPNAYVLVLNASNNWAFDYKIPCSDAEEIFQLNDRMYVASGEGITVINTNTSQKETIINTGLQGGAMSMVVSKGYLLWASYPDEQKLVAINLMDHSVQGIYNMPLDWMGQIAVNNSGTKIYSFQTEFDNDWNPLQGVIYEFDVDSKSYSEFYKGVRGSYFYSIGVSPFTNNVYTADVIGFKGNSRLLVLDASGNKIDQKDAGVGTCGFRFMRKGQ
jgi:hypothetical protein